MAHRRCGNRYSDPHFVAPPGVPVPIEEKSVPPETDAPAGQIDRDEVLRVIKEQLADILERDPSTINEGDSFAEDLHLGSLELIELVEAIEEEFGERSDGFRVEDEDLEDLKSVRDAVDYVVSRL